MWFGQLSPVYVLRTLCVTLVGLKNHSKYSFSGLEVGSYWSSTLVVFEEPTAIPSIAFRG